MMHTMLTALAATRTFAVQAGEPGQGDWHPDGHADSHTIWGTLGEISAWLVLAFALYLVVRAILAQGRYRAVDVLDEADLEAIHGEIIAAEKRTVGEILPVVVERSDPHPGAPWTAACLTTLLGSALLVGILPWDSPTALVLCQLAMGSAGFLLARVLPDFRRRFVRTARQRAVAEEQAFQEFYGNGLHETEGRTGVLIFVSLLEHRVVVLADRGIAAKVEPELWGKTDGAVLEGIRGGSLREGLVAGIRQCADVLAEHFPWEDGDRNEIPDRVIVRKE